MYSNRKLDQLIAQHVFNLPVIEATREHPVYDWYTEYNATADIWCDTGRRTPPPDRLPCGLLIPHYSTHIQAAWAVVEFIPVYFRLVRSTDDRDWAGPMHWYAQFAAPQRCEVRADTAPLAICLAALKFQGVPYEP